MQQLRDFLTLLGQRDFTTRFRVIQVTNPQPQPLFVARCLERLKAVQTIQIIACDMSALKKSHLQAQLEMSFLGSHSLYVMYAGGEGSAKYDASVIPYLNSYTGEHTIIVFTAAEVAMTSRTQAVSYTLAGSVNAQSYQDLYRFFCGEEIKNLRFVQHLFKHNEIISFDTACLMIQYHVLLGRNIDLFFAHWVDRIIVRKQSLFTLAQYLFAQDAHSFYAAWSLVAHMYPIEFWVAYWAEQIWQALIFITIAEQQGPVIAKKAISRLPFSFINKDWRLYTTHQLVRSYDRLYDFDYAHKHGSQNNPFELFFAPFFAGLQR